MPKYLYICPDCKHEYSEIREVTDPQWFTTCSVCGLAEYIEVTE